MQSTLFVPLVASIIESYKESDSSVRNCVDNKATLYTREPRILLSCGSMDRGIFEQES